MGEIKQCPECGSPLGRLSCRSCAESKRQKNLFFEQIASDFSLQRGIPNGIEGRKSLDRAIDCIKQSGETVSDYDSEELLESADWWYIPMAWIGSAGYIVDKATGDVNSLGSCHNLDDCIWAHQHGIVSSGSDFTMTSIQSLPVAVAVVSGFARITDDGRCIRYREQDAVKALETLPAHFQRHSLWFAIRDLRKAADNGDLTFECQPSYLRDL